MERTQLIDELSTYPQIEDLLIGIKHWSDQIKAEWRLGLGELEQILLQLLAPELTRLWPATSLVESRGQTNRVEIAPLATAESTQDSDWKIQTIQKNILFPVQFESTIQDEIWSWTLKATHPCEGLWSDLVFTVIAPCSEAEAWLYHLMNHTSTLTINGRVLRGHWDWVWDDPGRTLLSYYHSRELLYRFRFSSMQSFQLSAGECIQGQCRVKRNWPELIPGAIKLNTFPVTFTAPATAEPILIQPGESEYPLQYSDSGQFYECQNVTGVNLTGERRSWLPYCGQAYTQSPRYTLIRDWMNGEPRILVISDQPITDHRMMVDLRIHRYESRWVRAEFTPLQSNVPRYLTWHSCTKPSAPKEPSWWKEGKIESAILTAFMSSPRKLLQEGNIQALLSNYQWNEEVEGHLEVIRNSYKSIIDHGVLYRILKIECIAASEYCQSPEAAWLLISILKYWFDAKLEPGIRSQWQLSWGEYNLSSSTWN